MMQRKKSENKEILLTLWSSCVDQPYEELFQGSGTAISYLLNLNSRYQQVTFKKKVTIFISSYFFSVAKRVFYKIHKVRFFIAVSPNTY